MEYIEKIDKKIDDLDKNIVRSVAVIGSLWLAFDLWKWINSKQSKKFTNFQKYKCQWVLLSNFEDDDMVSLMA